MERRVVVIICFLMSIMSCSAQQAARKMPIVPNGKWICVQDPLSLIVIKGKHVSDYYHNKLIGTTQYVLTKQPCDKSYKTPVKNPLYLIWNEGLCYEVVGITKNYIELIFTPTGATLTYSREK